MALRCSIYAEIVQTGSAGFITSGHVENRLDRVIPIYSSLREAQSFMVIVRYLPENGIEVSFVWWNIGGIQQANFP